MPAPVAVELATGHTVGRYQLLFRLGKGGMGEVWAARQLSAVALGFRKIVALKVLRSRELTSDAAVMFLDEAKAASALEHAAIVPTLDLGRDDDVLYIAMELVRGPSLTALLQRLVIDGGQIPPALVAYLGARLTSALDYAHTRAQYRGQRLRLVHRDVSPHNILLDVHSGEVRLMDFGVARTSIQDHESRVGTVRGKPSYMAPEQVVGSRIDQRTDVFALGIVLYESASLKRLFGRTSPVKSMDAVVKHSPRPLTTMIDGFPDRLWQIIRRALDKDPARRWPNAADMHEALTEASRTLDPMTASLGHELVQLIHQHFDPGTFDVDARVRDLELLDPDLADSARPSAEVPAAATALWPAAVGSDPLAPDAIEAARTRFYAPDDHGAHPTRATFPPRSSDDGRTVTGSAGSMSGGHRPQRQWMVGPAAILGSAAVFLAATVGWVTWSGRGDPIPLAPVPPAPVAPPAPHVRPSPPSVVAAEPARTETALSPPPAAPPPAANEAPPPKPRTPKASTARRPRPRRTTRDRTSRKRTRRPQRASYEAVHRLLLQVKEVDEAKGTAMIVTLAEAGRDNAAALKRLHEEARAFLRTHNK